MQSAKKYVEQYQNHTEMRKHLSQNKIAFVAKRSHMKLIGSHQLCKEIQLHTKAKRYTLID